uniref:succinate dehydrogenase subunit 3 n=1 Tax=Hypnea nidulans TaxID=673449 RepID=UPI003001F52E|nr:succinate dehydrogenase subunit 3 [Hypnea nidulans]
MLNRPISPHLSVYDSQFTSLSSIWHRISGIFLLLIIVSFSIILKYGTLIIFYIPTICLRFKSILFIYLLCLFFFSYHSFSGIRYIGWSLIHGLNPTSLRYSFCIICICVIIITVYSII